MNGIVNPNIYLTLIPFQYKVIEVYLISPVILFGEIKIKLKM